MSTFGSSVRLRLLLVAALSAAYLALQLCVASVAGAAPPILPVDDEATTNTAPERRAGLGAPPPTLVSLADGEEVLHLVYHPVANGQVGVLWLSGIDGGIDGPYDGFYSRLASGLQRRGLASVQLINREPGNFELSLHEALVALDFMREEGLNDLAIVGFSFGGGVAVEAAAERAEARTLIMLSGQGYGTDNVAAIAPRPILIVHAEGDTNIPLDVARDVLERAQVPAELIVVAGDDHYLRDVRGQVRGIISRWLRDAFHVPDEPRHGGPPLSGSLPRWQESE